MRRNSLPIVAAALSLAGLLAAAPASATSEPAPAPASTEVAEALTGISVRTKLIDKLGTDALAISVSVSGETATLTGEVTKSPSQALAQEVALSVPGIKKVDNKVTVKYAASGVAASEASVNNVALEMKVKSILLTEIGVNALKIEVEAVDGVVSLRGKLDNPDTSKAAVKRTHAIKGVKKVVDLLG
jgi:osmotically-inducible protein OsmY